MRRRSFQAKETACTEAGVVVVGGVCSVKGTAGMVELRRRIAGMGVGEGWRNQVITGMNVDLHSEAFGSPLRRAVRNGVWERIGGERAAEWQRKEDTG